MSQEIGSVGTAYVELQADLSALQSQFQEAVQDAGQAGQSAGRAFGQGVGAGVNLAPVTAQLGLFEEATTQVASSAEQMGLAFHESSVIAVTSADAMATAVEEVETSTEGAKTGLLAYTAGLEESRASINRFGTEAQNLGMVLSVGVTLPLAGLAAASIKAYGDIDSLKRGLTAVAGSAEEAAKQFADMQEVAKLPGLGLEEAVQGSIRLQAFGFSASQAKDTLMAFGNAIATVGGGKAELDRVIVQLGQMAGAGKVLQQDLRPIIEQVPQVAAIIKKSFGPDAIGEPGKVLDSLGVSSKQFIQTLVTELGKLPPVTGGIKNDMENMSDAIKLALADIGQSLAPAFHEITEVAVPAIQALVHAFTSLPVPIQSGIIVVAGMAAALGPLLVTVGLVTKGYADIVGMVNLAAKAFEVTTPAVEALAAAQATEAATAATTTTAIEAETAAVILAGETAEEAAARMVAFSEAEAGIGAEAGLAAGAAGAGGVLGFNAALVELASTLALPAIAVTLVALLPVALAKLIDVMEAASSSAHDYNVHLSETASIMTMTHAPTEAVVKDLTDWAGAVLKNIPLQESLNKGALDLIKTQGQLRAEYTAAQQTYQLLLDAQAQGKDVAVALALAHDKVTEALKKLNPQLAENEKAQKAVTEALKADSAERNKQDQLALTIFDQKKKALADLEAAEKSATQAGKDDVDFTAKIQKAKDDLTAALTNLETVVHRNAAEQLAANEGMKTAADVTEKQATEIGKVKQATYDYTEAIKLATQQQILHQIAMTGSFNTVEHGITVFHDVGTAMQDAAKAGTLTWAQVQKSIESVRDSIVRVPDAITGVLTSMEVLRGQGIQKVSTLADSIGGLKTAFLSVTDALNGTQSAVPQWVLNNTVAIVNGVYVVSDAAKALFESNTALAQSQEKVAGAQQTVTQVMVAGQAVMVTSNSVTSSATTAAQDLAKAAAEAAAGMTGAGNAAAASVGGIKAATQSWIDLANAEDAAAAAADQAEKAADKAATHAAFGTGIVSGADQGGSEMVVIDNPQIDEQNARNGIVPKVGDISNSAPNSMGGWNISTWTQAQVEQLQKIADLQTAVTNLVSSLGGTESDWQEFLTSQIHATGQSAQAIAQETISRLQNTDAVIASTDAQAQQMKQADAVTPTLSDMTDQLWRLVDAGQGGSTAAWDLRNQIAALQTTTVATTNAYQDATAAAVSFGSAITDVAATAVAAATVTTAAAQSTKAALGIVSAPTPTPVTPSGPADPAAGTAILNPDTWFSMEPGKALTINVYGQTAAAVGQQVTQILRAAGMN